MHMNNNLMTVEHYASNVSFQAYCLKTDEEAIQYWTNYLKEHPDQEDNIKQAKKIVELLSLQLSEKEILIEKEKIKPHFIEIASAAKSQSSSNRTFNLWRTMASMAAVGLLVIACTTYWFSQQTADKIDYITQSFSEPTKLELSDGSTVFLATNASIKHEQTWEKNDDREIWLTGKAFFDVRKKPLVANDKFIVHTSQGTVEVLGTSFTIDDDKENFEVILETGKLAFHSNDQQSVILEPDDKVFFQNGTLKKEKVNASYYSVWKEDQLIFEDQPVSEIVATLEASFDLNIKVEHQELLKRKVTASIPKNDPELLLQALSEIYDIQIIRSNKNITLK